MATFERRLSDDGKESWRVKVRLRGHPPATATFERKTDAKKWAGATESAIREGRYFATSESRKHTVADLIDRYTRDVLPQKKSARSQVAQFAWWRAELGTLTLKDLTPARIGEARDALARGTTPRGERRTPATVSRYLAALSHALTVAVKEWGWLDDTPMRKVRKPREPRGRVRFLSEDERARLLASCKAGPPWLEPVVLLALSTGMRQGEILGLRWADLDLKRRCAVLHETKNGERRSVPVTGLALEVMRRWSKLRRLDSDRVFPDVGSLSHRWADALERAQIENFRFHDLRHTAASYLAMNGATLGEIGAVLGHKTPSMVQRYAHLSDSHIAGVVERMNAKFIGS